MHLVNLAIDLVLYLSHMQAHELILLIQVSSKGEHRIYKVCGHGIFLGGVEVSQLDTVEILRQ